MTIFLMVWTSSAGVFIERSLDTTSPISRASGVQLAGGSHVCLHQAGSIVRVVDELPEVTRTSSRAALSISPSSLRAGRRYLKN